MTLASVDASALAAYADEIASTRSQHEAIIYLTPVRGVLGRLAIAGILAGNPCPPGQPNGRKTRDMIDEGAARLPPSDPTRAERGIGDGPQQEAGEESPRQAGPVGFPLLDLMAMLGHMEERSLGRIFDEDVIALRLLERVRWPEEPMCPHCGAEAGWDEESRGPAACPACGQRFDALTGTMFEGSAFPLRLWLVVIHQMHLAGTTMPDAELRERFGLDLPAVLSLARRIGEAMVQEGLPAGEELARVLDRRDRELVQEDVVRAIKEYAALEAERDRLLLARAEGSAVDGLPPGMTPDQALALIEARIAEHDRYVISCEDGYLVRSWPEPPVERPPDLPASPAAEPIDGSKEASDAG